MIRFLLLGLSAGLLSPITAEAHSATGNNSSLSWYFSYGGSPWECDKYGKSNAYCYEFPHTDSLGAYFNSRPTHINIYSIPSYGKNTIFGVGAYCKKGCVGKWIGQGKAAFKIDSGYYSFSNQYILCKGLRSVARGEKYGHCHVVTQ